MSVSALALGIMLIWPLPIVKFEASKIAFGFTRVENVESIMSPRPEIFAPASTEIMGLMLSVNEARE